LEKLRFWQRWQSEHTLWVTVFLLRWAAAVVHTGTRQAAASIIASTIPAPVVTAAVRAVQIYAVKKSSGVALHLKSFLRPKFAENSASGAKPKILRPFVYDYE